MSTVVLSGATGFLGRHLAAALLHRGATVVALLRDAAAADRLHALLPPGPAGRLLTLHAARDDLPSAVDAALAGATPTAVVHAATCYGRRDEPDSALHEANEALPLRLWLLAAALGAGGLVHLDTVLAAAASRYARSKAAGREALRMAAGTAPATAARPLVNLRLEHLYGPGDGDDRFLPWLIARCRGGDPAIGLGPAATRREFVHVADAVTACLALIDALPALAPGWHDTRASGDATTIGALSERVRDLTGSVARLDFGARPGRPVELDPRRPDDALLRRLGWRRRVALQAGLRHMLDAAPPATSTPPAPPASRAPSPLRTPWAIPS
jgi:nucleoside-diphosphate-sugar epimerase